MLNWFCFFFPCTFSYTSISKFPVRNRVIPPVSLTSQQDTSLITRQWVLTHKIHQTEIPTFLGSWVTTLCPQTIVCPYIFVKKITCLNIGLPRIGQLFFFFISCKTVCRGVTTNCCYMNDIVFFPPFHLHLPVRNSGPPFPCAHCS